MLSSFACASALFLSPLFVSISIYRSVSNYLGTFLLHSNVLSLFYRYRMYLQPRVRFWWYRCIFNRGCVLEDRLHETFDYFSFNQKTFLLSNDLKWRLLSSMLTGHLLSFRTPNLVVYFQVLRALCCSQRLVGHHPPSFIFLNHHHLFRRKGNSSGGGPLSAVTFEV